MNHENAQGHEERKVVTNEIIDIEECAKAGKKPPKAKSYQIKIDKTKYKVDVPEMTGREILLLAGKNPPENFQLNQKIHGQPQPVALGEMVDFTKPGIEKFMTIPLDQQAG